MKQGPLRRWKRIIFTEKLERKSLIPLKCKGEKVKMALTIGFGCKGQKQKLLHYLCFSDYSHIQDVPLYSK